MSAYFFHLHDGVDVLLDPDGRELHASKVPQAALDEARQLISHDANSGRIKLDQCIEVWDAGGAMIHRLKFVDAIEIVMPGAAKVHEIRLPA